MVLRVVPKDSLERVPPDLVPAMIIDRLDRAHGEQDDTLPDGHPRCRMSQHGTEGIEEESFERMVVERSESIWNVKFVVDRVEVAVEERNGVEQPMEKVLPSVHDEAGAHRKERLF